MKKKTMTVALALLLAAGGCRSGMEATEAMKTTETSSMDAAVSDSVATTVSEKILSSIHRIEDECAAAIVRFVDGGGEITVTPEGETSASGVASIEGTRRAASTTVKADYGDSEQKTVAVAKEEMTLEEQTGSEESRSERKTDSSQGSMWLSVFFLCLGYFLTGAAIRISKHAKE